MTLEYQKITPVCQPISYIVRLRLSLGKLVRISTVAIFDCLLDFYYFYKKGHIRFSTAVGPDNERRKWFRKFYNHGINSTQSPWIYINGNECTCYIRITVLILLPKIFDYFWFCNELSFSYFWLYKKFTLIIELNLGYLFNV